MVPSFGEAAHRVVWLMSFHIFVNGLFGRGMGNSARTPSPLAQIAVQYLKLYIARTYLNIFFVSPDTN